MRSPPKKWLYSGGAVEPAKSCRAALCYPSNTLIARAIPHFVIIKYSLLSSSQSRVCSHMKLDYCWSTNGTLR